MAKNDSDSVIYVSSGSEEASDIPEKKAPLPSKSKPVKTKEEIELENMTWSEFEQHLSEQFVCSCCWGRSLERGGCRWDEKAERRKERKERERKGKERKERERRMISKIETIKIESD